jgi:hypothetical protein
MAGATTNTQYTINAVNNATGTIDFTGRDSAAVFRSAAANMQTSGSALMYFKNGTYPCQTSLQESVASQTNYYCNATPAPNPNNQPVSWHIVCESIQQFFYGKVSTGSCLHPALPSAWAGPQLNNKSLSVFWQRPNATNGTLNNSALFFYGGNCRIPHNQIPSGAICYDSFTTEYSSHIGTMADTQIAAADQLCSGYTAPVTGIFGYRTNQTATDEAWFEDTWAVGMYTGYNIISNHPMLFNAHAACGNIPAILAVNLDSYGGYLWHFGDYHNINGMQYNCTVPGTRFDNLNMVWEPTSSGAFANTGGATESTPGNCNGKVEVTTGSGNGAALTYKTYFNSGNGANFRVVESERGLIPGLVTSNFTSAATTGTTKQTLATYSFPYTNNTQGVTLGAFQTNPGAVFRIKAWGINVSNTGNDTLEIDFGGTAIATITSTQANSAIRCEAEIIVSSVANTQEILGTCDDGTLHTVTRTAPGITGSAAIALNVAMTSAAGAGQGVFKGLTIEYVGGQ